MSTLGNTATCIGSNHADAAPSPPRNSAIVGGYQPSPLGEGPDVAAGASQIADQDG